MNSSDDWFNQTLTSSTSSPEVFFGDRSRSPSTTTQASTKMPPPTETVPFTTPNQSHQTKGRHTDHKNPVILTSGLTSSMLTHVGMLVSRIGGRLETQWSPQVTHLVTISKENRKPERRTFKYLQCVLTGCWIINFDWIIASTRARRWVEEKTYELTLDSSSQSEEDRTVRDIWSPDRLLYGYRFFLHGDFDPKMEDVLVSKSQVEALIRCGHGVILDKMPTLPKDTLEMLSERNQKTIVLTSCPKFSGKNLTELQNLFLTTGRPPVSVQWLLDSISCYEILKPSHYYAFFPQLNEGVVNGDETEDTDSIAVTSNKSVPSSSSWYQTQNSMEL